MPSRTLRAICVSALVLLTWVLMVIVVALAPSKLTVENNVDYQTMFVNLSEKHRISVELLSTYDGLERLDILFKNPNLESRDELEIVVSRSNGSVVVSKPVSGFNLGDTSHARVDLPKNSIGKGEMLNVEVVATKVVDGKLMIGEKNGDINVIQYYSAGGWSSFIQRIVGVLNKIMSWPLVLILPLVIGVVAVW